jgi:hypothetical protein
MRLVVLLAGLLASAPAFAGGLGPLVMGGVHTEKVAYYSTATDPPVQHTQQQMIGNVGAGLELVLGDRDDLIQGVFRGYWMMDTAQQDPSKRATDVPAADFVANWREKEKHVGVGSVGLNFGVLRAASDKFKLSVAVHLGSGFLTTDHTEFMLAQAGLNMSYLLSRKMEWYVDVAYGLRVRKELSHGAYGTMGIRVMFD